MGDDDDAATEGLSDDVSTRRDVAFDVIILGTGPPLELPLLIDDPDFADEVIVVVVVVTVFGSVETPLFPPPPKNLLFAVLKLALVLMGVLLLLLLMLLLLADETGS